MYPLQLDLEGYRRYKEPASFRFRTGATLILGAKLDDPKSSSNGSGKSSLLYAICAACYGQEPHGGRKTDLISHGLDRYTLKLTLGEEGMAPSDMLYIRRSMARKGSEELEFWYKGRHCEGKFPVVQAELDKILGQSFELFCCTNFVSRTCRAAEFVRAKPSERMALLEQMVSDTRLMAAEERTQAVLKMLEADTRDAATKLRMLESEEQRTREEYSTLQARLVSAQQQGALFHQARATRCSNIQREIDMLSQTFAQHVDLEPVQTALNNAQSSLIQHRSAMEVRRRLQSNVSLEGLQSCPCCHQPVTDDIRKKRALSGQAVDIELRQMALKETELLETINQCNRELGRRQVAHTAQMGVTQQIEQKTRELLLAQQEQAPDFTSGYEALVRDNLQKQANLQAQVFMLRATAEANALKREKYKVWLEGFGKRGIRNLLMDDVRVLLEHFAHQHLFQLAGDELQLQFPQCVRGLGADRFDIVARTPEGEQDLCMFSDGEHWKLTFACLLGLGDAMMHGTPALLKFRLLDDVFGDLDPSAQREFMLSVEHLSRQYPVLVTLPFDSPVDIKANTIRIERRGLVSYNAA